MMGSEMAKVVMIEVTRIWNVPGSRTTCWYRAERVVELRPANKDGDRTILVMRDPKETIRIVEEADDVIRAMNGILWRVGDPDVV